MSLRIEQNRKWSNKTFPYTLCVVSPSHKTTHCGICVTSILTKTCTGHQGAGGGGGGEFGLKNAFFGTIFSLKIGVLLGKYFRKQTNS